MARALDDEATSAFSRVLRRDELVGRYRVVEEIEAGHVYRAHDHGLTRDVALRLISQEADPEIVASLARLQHPNVVTVFDICVHRGDVYVATELLHGVTARAWLTDGARRWRDVVAVFQQAGLGLSAAHAADVVHGDVGLDSIIVSPDGRARVVDFAVTRTTADAAADQRAFCAAFREALGCERARVPAWVERIVERGLSREPYPSMAALVDDVARDRSAKRTMLVVAAVIAVGAVTLAVSIGRRSSHAPPCGSARPLLAGAWGPVQRAALSAAFAKVDAPWANDVHHSVETMLDRYTAGWVDMHRESCEATRVRGTQSEMVLDLRTACLGQHLDELREKVGVLVAGDRTTLERAIEIMRGLPALETCADVAALTSPVPLPTSPDARQKVEQDRKQLARARALIDAAKFAEAAELAATVSREADVLQYHPLKAEALYAQSSALEREGNYRDAITTARDASREANAGRDDRVAAEALISLVWLVGAREHKYDEAHDFAREAAAAIERLDRRADLEGELAGNLGALYANEERLDDALAQHQRHLALAEQSLGPTAPTLGGILVDIGEVYREQGRNAEALASYERALDIFESAWGPRHPTVAVPLNDMGMIMHRLGRDDEALEYHRRALAIFTQALGPSHPHVAEARTDIGVVLLTQGHADAAYDEFHRALAIDSAVSGDESVECAIDRINMADALRAAHKLADSSAEGHRAAAIAEKVVGRDDPTTAEAYLSLGRTLRAQGAPTEAITQLERALAIWRQPDVQFQAGIGEALAELGAARLALGERRAAADALEEAITLLEKASRDPSILTMAREQLARAKPTTPHASRH